MRSSWMLLVPLAVGCGGKTPPDAAKIEQCDNSIDDDGDGLEDCMDPDCDGKCHTGWTTSGTPTGTVVTIPTYTGTTGVTNPSSPLTLSIDPTIHVWQHEVGLTQCPQNLGRIIVENTSSEQAQLIVSSERYLERNVFSFQLDSAPIEFWVDFPIPAGQQSVVTVYYACTADASFGHLINVDFRRGAGDTSGNAATIWSQGTIL